MPKPYKKLRAKMQEEDYDRERLGKVIGVIDKGAMSNRMTNKTPWKITEIYKIMNALGIPHSELCLYFSESDVEYEGGIH